MAATRAAAGSVSTQATTMLAATPQRTADARVVAPAPSTEPEITCVVEIGKPTLPVYQRTVVAAVCAAKPCGDSRLKIRVPIVRMIRQPPTYVPSPMARPEATITQSGTVADWLMWPL